MIWPYRQRHQQRWTDLAALQCLGRVGGGDGSVELVLWFTQQGDHFTVGVVAILHDLVRLHGLVQDVAEVASLWEERRRKERGGDIVNTG